MTEKEEVRIGIDLNKEATKKFYMVKQKLGIESNADVIRWLINWYYEQIKPTTE